MELLMVIGIDKRNPLFTIYRDAKRAKVYIYYGVILHEVIGDKKKLKLLLWFRNRNRNLLLERLANRSLISQK